MITLTLSMFICQKLPQRCLELFPDKSQYFKVHFYIRLAHDCLKQAQRKIML